MLRLADVWIVVGYEPPRDGVSKSGPEVMSVLRWQENKALQKKRRFLVFLTYSWMAVFFCFLLLLAVQLSDGKS